MKELIYKFLTTWHLDVYERNQFKYGIQSEDLINAIITYVNEHGQFPINYKLSDDFAGSILYKKDDGYYYIHHKVESGVNRYSDLKELKFKNLNIAAKKYIKSVFGKEMDGINIIWK